MSSKSSSNATRFTATSPTAHSRSSLSRSLPSRKAAQDAAAQNTSPTSSPTNPSAAVKPPNPSSTGETPAQKVARLRKEHEARKLAKFSLWERTVLKGRVAADVAHRMTVFGIMGFSAVTGVIAVYSLSNMIVHNRRKRKQWFQEQTEIYHIKLHTAIQNARAGIATDDDILVINQERAIRAAEEAKRAKQSLFQRAKGLFLYGLGDKPDERIRTQMEIEAGVRERELSPLEQLDRDTQVQRASPEPAGLAVGIEAAQKPSSVVSALQAGQRHDVHGGSLDRLAESVSQSAKEGWSRWFSGSRRSEFDRERETKTG